MRVLATLLCLCGTAMIGCTPPNMPGVQTDVEHPTDPSAVTRTPTRAIGDVATAAMTSDDPASFVPAGATLVDSVLGDLTGGGRSDALIVFAPASSEQDRLGEGPARTVVLLARDQSGRLQRAAENARLIPCARCGGVAGDPYGDARIDAGTVTIAVSGGSRERWFSDYVFRYAAEQGDWLLDRVIRGVTDTQTGIQKQAELTAADFGEMPFSRFDPGSLQAAPTLD